MGVIAVPVVNACYLVRSDVIKYVSYDDRSRRAEYVVFSAKLREEGVPQYVDNTRNYGILLNYKGKTPEEIEDVDSINNKAFYLNISKRDKRGVICDADWLSRYVIGEHIYLIRILRESYNFDIINCGRLDVGQRNFIDDLNSYDVLLTAYHVMNKIPLDRVSSYKIYKLDDMQNDDEYTKIIHFNISNSDMIISPYAYVFGEYYRHDNVVWVPYSCALEGFRDWQLIEFSKSPKLKVLQSGHVHSSYPFRTYVSSLNNEGLEKLPHQGWVKASVDGQTQIIGLEYYKKLNEYICCFTDALKYRYIVLKNFEIAATGSLLLTDRAVEKEMNELGFIDRRTCVFTSRETFLQDLEWILDPRNREEIDEIRSAGMKLVRDRHMTRHRAARIHRVAADAIGLRHPRADLESDLKQSD